MAITRENTMQGALRRVQVGNALSAFGSGFTLPYMFVYVEHVRGLGSLTAWLVFTLFAAAALVVLPLGGRGIDRFGPRPVLVAGAVLTALGAASFGLATTHWTILLAAFLFGAGVTTCQPALATMVVRCSTRTTRAHAFALQFTLVNLGMGIGAMIGGQIVDVSRPGSLTLLFSIEAVMFLVLAAVTGSVRLPAVSVVAEESPAAAERGRSDFRTLLGDHAMVKLSVLAGLIFFACYGQFESGVAAYATSTVGISPSALGLGLGVNTFAIVLLQMVVVRITSRRRRTTAIAATGVVWLAAWIFAAVAGLFHGGSFAAIGSMMMTYALFGVGEALLAPTLGPIVADLAPARLLGTYNAAFALVKQVAIALGPALGVLLVGAGLSTVYLAALALCCVAITVAAWRLRRVLPAVADNAVPARSTVVAGSQHTVELATAA
ncbi:MFS transporter [Streptacidiphilus jiangxiensis]|uniref:Predicted arabinose efflux permease, MFS family n=1 Tax=Streptacidiphilus jiangxiensis TaxID=235985 RepID=A0A1H7JYZ0_STRJI|nr:MFS transporter [Streptacidiphilus jiangxiensis]SEK79769.1 Predicted arabinose efflux permease, MFS family [Streptacidiphilus jiangxiensis]